MQHQNGVLTNLDGESLIRVSGVDAVPFLQGQLSTDVEKLTSATSQFSSWNNAKGRVVTLLRVFRRGEDVYLALPIGLKAAVQKRLSMYVLRSKVTLTDAGDLVGLGLSGENATSLLTQAGIQPPPTADSVTEAGGIQVVHLFGPTPRFALYGSSDAIAGLKKKLEATGTVQGNKEQWALHKILAGEPTVYSETSEHFVAQMLDLDTLGGIDFKKGCYTGQEVIARAHYRGGVKRHLARASSQTTVALKPGADIHALGQDSPVAEVVDARLDVHSLWQMLLVVQDDFRDKDLVHAASGAAVNILKS